MPQYALLLRGGYETFAKYTPEEIRQSIQKYGDWAGQLGSQDRLAAAEKIKDGDRRILSVRNGELVVEGPYPDTEETIGGYFIIKAVDLDEAIEIAKGCPIFGDGGTIELREIEQT